PSIPCLCLCSFTPTSTTEIFSLSLHDALPICSFARVQSGRFCFVRWRRSGCDTRRGIQGRRRKSRGLPFLSGLLRFRVFHHGHQDRKSTRLNSSHRTISYAVFCLKKKNTH